MKLTQIGIIIVNPGSCSKETIWTLMWEEKIPHKLIEKMKEMTGATSCPLFWPCSKKLWNVETKSKPKTPCAFTLRCLGWLWHRSTSSSSPVYLHHERIIILVFVFTSEINTQIAWCSEIREVSPATWTQSCTKDRIIISGLHWASTTGTSLSKVSPLCFLEGESG